MGARADPCWADYYTTPSPTAQRGAGAIGAIPPASAGIPGIRDPAVRSRIFVRQSVAVLVSGCMVLVCAGKLYRYRVKREEGGYY
jgi:hypothetical protein